MIRQTSIDVYNQILADGTLGNRQMLVYDTIFKHGPLTQMETVRTIDDPDIVEHGLTPRFAELKRMGAIVEVGERECTITGRNVILWDVTDRLPDKAFLRKKSKKETIEELEQLVTELMAENESLKSRLSKTISL